MDCNTSKKIPLTLKTAIIGRLLDFKSSNDCRLIVLKVIVEELDYPLITTYGPTKELVAKKALIMLEICYLASHDHYYKAISSICN